jgi:hypothetical protein
LLHLQKPGLRFVASKLDWKRRFNRTITEGARPLLILWPFAPVALVYDVDDTEGDDVLAFFDTHLIDIAFNKSRGVKENPHQISLFLINFTLL